MIKLLNLLKKLEKRIKLRILNWLLSDVELSELRVKTLVADPVKTNYIDLEKLTSDPSLATGRFWFRDTGEVKFSPDGSTTKVIHPPNWNDITNKPSKFPPEPHASTHAKGGSDELNLSGYITSPLAWNTTNKVIYIPDRAITRSKLEKPTENVTLGYFSVINSITYCSRSHSGFLVLTEDVYTDKAIEGICCGNRFAEIHARVQDSQNFYVSTINIGASSGDHYLSKRESGSETKLATESVDLDTRGFILCISCSGSTIKSMRYFPSSPTKSITDVTPDYTLTATDTSFASGRFGIRPLRENYPHGCVNTVSAKLLPPQSSGLRAVAIAIMDIEGDGTIDNPLRPKLISELREIKEFKDVLPPYLVEEAKRYYILKNRGFTDDEIQAILGYIPQHQIDVMSVSWGAFDFNKDSPYYVITIYGSNPYKNAIEKQLEKAKKVYKPRDKVTVIEIYKQLKKEFNFLAGKDNFLYQVFGDQIYELFATVDFYYGELLEHKTHYDQIKHVNLNEIKKILKNLQIQLEKITVLHNERDKHLKKIRELLKKGW